MEDHDNSDHICERNFEEKFELVVTDETADGIYKCGCCTKRLRTICLLHEHLLKEFSFGSYLYDHDTKTAYPKQASVAVETQTEIQDWTEGSSGSLLKDSKCNVDYKGDHTANGAHSEETSPASHSRKRKHLKEEKIQSVLAQVSGKKTKTSSKEVLVPDTEIPTEKANFDSETSEETYLPLERSKEQSTGFSVKEETLVDQYDESTDDNLDFESIPKVIRKTNIKTKIRIKKDSIKSVKQPKVQVRKKKKPAKVSKRNKIDMDKNKEYSDTETVDDTLHDLKLNDLIIDTERAEKTSIRPKVVKEMFSCQHCDSTFKNEGWLNGHLQRVHKCIYPYCCKQCRRKPFKTKEEYLEHKETHPQKLHSCDLCGKELKSREGMRLHEFTHSGLKPFSCTECDYRGRTAAQLRQHMFNHNETKTEQCELCGKAFFTKGKLKEHHRYCSKEFNHHCPYCQKGFPTASGLRKHFLMHTGEREFICDVCGFATFRTTLLKSHMRTHTGEKPYKCKECGAQLATRGTLLLHLRTHTHEKPFVCSFCSKAFTSKWNLKTHLRQHTGEKPYKCDICGQGFKQNVLRKSHMRGHLESVEPVVRTHVDAASEIHTVDQPVPEIPEHLVQTDVDIPKAVEAGRLTGNKLEPNKSYIVDFEYDRTGRDILQQALQSENIHPVDLKLNFSTADDLKNAYNTSVINSYQLP